MASEYGPVLGNLKQVWRQRMLTPASVKAKATPPMPTADEMAKRKEAREAEYREYHLEEIEHNTERLQAEIATRLESLSLYTDERRARLGALVPQLRALADSILTALQSGEEQSA